ncbi:MBL fold metallo-hydrolase [Auraticoccus sp. F435]|uniref:MBL fold metallo-hydrolase n=1 Tax=Auraticoccus cholistanensis TaxID=2656650 RepID=A0A6A9UTX4_9ACTN|nr:MBL fold metallo-hydrolase [Auraticoccus cholistanensis]MVA75034.1 MBL fold metallo-hydrolase [Auraticoccus cholistanensis]
MRDETRVWEVAEDVLCVSDHGVNSYLVRDGGEVTVVDAGLPAAWEPLQDALRRLGRSVERAAALVLTHAHFDHIGTARRFVEAGVPVYLHADDHALAAHPYRYGHERSRWLYPLQHPRALPVLTSMVRGGALRVPPVQGCRAMVDGEELPVPGGLQVLATPGHTWGHCSLLLPGRDAVLSGDALVTLDPYTARTGPCLVAGAATASSSRAGASLARLRGCGAKNVLPGHGRPWHDGVADAVDLALARPQQ